MISDVLREFDRRYIEIFRREGGSRAYYKSLTRLFCGALGDKRNISSVDAEAWIRTRRKAGIKDSTINQELSFLKHALGWAANKKIILVNPLADFPALRIQKRKRLRPDEKVIARAIDKSGQAANLFIFMAETGARPSEAASLTIPDIFWADQMVRFNFTKDMEARFLPISKKCEGALREAAGDRQDGLVFLSPEGKPWIYRRLDRIWKRAGGENLKDLRRIFGIHLSEAGVDMRIIQQLYGHSSVATTENNYLDYSPGRSPAKQALTFLTTSVVCANNVNKKFTCQKRLGGEKSCG